MIQGEIYQCAKIPGEGEVTEESKGEVLVQNEGKYKWCTGMSCTFRIGIYSVLFDYSIQILVFKTGEWIRHGTEWLSTSWRTLEVET